MYLLKKINKKKGTIFFGHGVQYVTAVLEIYLKYDYDHEIEGNNDHFLALLLVLYYIIKENLKCAILRYFNFLWELKDCYKMDTIKYLKSALPSALFKVQSGYTNKVNETNIRNIT